MAPGGAGQRAGGGVIGTALLVGAVLAAPPTRRSPEPFASGAAAVGGSAIGLFGGALIGLAVAPSGCGDQPDCDEGIVGPVTGGLIGLIVGGPLALLAYNQGGTYGADATWTFGGSLTGFALGMGVLYGLTRLDTGNDALAGVGIGLTLVGPALMATTFNIWGTPTAPKVTVVPTPEGGLGLGIGGLF